MADAEKTIAHCLQLMRSGQMQKAVPLLDTLLQDEPRNFDALRLRGIVSQLSGRPDEALGYLEKAAAVDGEHAQTQYNLGVVLSQIDRHEDALARFERAIELDDQDADSLNARGSALTKLKRFDVAISSFREAIVRRPGFAEAHNNLAYALGAVSLWDEAIASAREALRLDPRSIVTRINLGGLLNRIGRYEEAETVLREAVSIDGRSAEAFSNLGVTLNHLKRFDEARDCFARAVEINPDHDNAFSQSALTARRICDWTDYARTQKGLKERIAREGSSVSPFVFLAYSDDPEEQLLCARRYAAHKGFGQAGQPFTWDRIGNDRTRVAYVSADFREHPVAYQIAELIERHDRDRFEIVGISMGRDDGSAIRARLKNAFDAFVDVRAMSDRQAAETIAEHGVHVAVDLNGYTADARPEIFAMRPAPIQANYLGYPCTMGAGFMDYVIVDPYIVPPEKAACLAEKPVYLPESYLVTDSTRLVPDDAGSRRDAGLPEDGCVFCCFHNSYKITPDTFGIWMRLLEAVPGSVLWMRADNDIAVANLRREASARNVDPDRLVLADRLDMADHLARHRLADLFLDTLPYNAHSSACDALWAGLPVVTCPGQSFAGRVAGSLLNAVGLPELIASSTAQYEALALELAKDRERLAHIQAKLRQTRDAQPLFDCTRFCRHIEAAYETMVEKWRAGEPPAPITVSPVG